MDLVLTRRGPKNADVICTYMPSCARFDLPHHGGFARCIMPAMMRSPVGGITSRHSNAFVFPTEDDIPLGKGRERWRGRGRRLNHRPLLSPLAVGGSGGGSDRAAQCPDDLRRRRPRRRRQVKSVAGVLSTCATIRQGVSCFKGDENQRSLHVFAKKAKTIPHCSCSTTMNNEPNRTPCDCLSEGSLSGVEAQIRFKGEEGAKRW